MGIDRRWHRAVPHLLVVVALSATVFAGVTGAPAGAIPSGTRYLDAVFAGQVSPPVTASYDPSIDLNRASTLIVTAGGGTYTISYNGSTTAPLAPTATAAEIQAAIHALSSLTPPNDVVVTGGPGGGSGGLAYRIAFTGPRPGDGFGRLTTDASGLTGLIRQAMVQCDRCLDLHVPMEGSPPVGGRPVVVLLHSGGFVGGAKDSVSDPAAGARMEAWASSFATRGYVVAVVNYTLSDPVAVSIADCDWDALAGPACPQAWYDAVANAQHDAQAAIRWLRMTALPAGGGGLGNPFAINDQFLVLGESAGAYAALNVLYKPDDPGTVGVTTGSSAVSSAAALAGMMKDVDQRAGAGPALLLTFTNDPLGQFLGQDMYDQSRQVVARAGAVGNLAELASYCRRIPSTPGGPENPVHLVNTDQPEFAHQIVQVTRFFYEHVSGPSPTTTPTPSRWAGGTRSTPFVPRGGQTLYGSHENVRGDFDGDGRDDVFAYGPGAECDTIWYGLADHTFFDPKETSWSGFVPVAEFGDHYTPAVIDIDGDGRQDIFWYEPTTSAAMIWYGNADRTFTVNALPTLLPSLETAVGDFDGDGLGDLLLYSSAHATALVAFGTSTRGTLSGITYLSGLGSGLVPFVGDFDGDAKSDVYWRGASGAKLWYGLANAGALSFEVSPTAPTIAGTNAPMIGDLDGDGKTDLFWYQPVSVAIWYGQAARTGFIAGRTWYLAAGWTIASGDFDADGKMDVVWHQATKTDTIWYGHANRTTGVSMQYLAWTPAAAYTPIGGRFSGRVIGGRPISDLMWALVP